MERLKVASDEKLTELGRKFHTFIALSAKKKFLRVVLPQRGLNNLYGCPLVCDEGLTMKKSSNLTLTKPNTIL